MRDRGEVMLRLRRCVVTAGIWSIVMMSSASAQADRNWYRSLYTCYDSVVICCMYGEMYLVPASGRAAATSISWANCIPATLDTACSVINRITQTVPFVISESSKLHMFRMITRQLPDNDVATWTLPDTTAWTMELWNWSTHEKIATLDSVGLCKAVNRAPSQSPDGFGPGWNLPYEVATIDLGTYASAVNPGDSVIIRLKIHNWLPSADSATAIRDDVTGLKFSQWLPRQRRP